MQDSNVPAKFPIPFASSAGTGFIRPIPQASQIGVQNGAASLTDGFPPNCFSPIAAGGSWPFGQDFNGLLNQITAWVQWMNAAGPIYYDGAFSSSIGGYPKGAIVASATFGGFWLCTVDNNTSDPDTGGAGWLGQWLASNGIQVFTASATFTVPTGVTRVRATTIGGGGGGGGSVAGGFGSGGGAGGYAYGVCVVTSGASIPVTIGAGGAAGNSTANGGNGTSTSFGTFVSATGGAGGASNSPNGGQGGAGAGGQILEPGEWGRGGFLTGANQIFIGGEGGGNTFGPGARYVVNPLNGAINGVAGQVSGTGGSGGASSVGSAATVTGGAGAAGLVVVEW